VLLSVVVLCVAAIGALVLYFSGGRPPRT